MCTFPTRLLLFVLIFLKFSMTSSSILELFAKNAWLKKILCIYPYGQTETQISRLPNNSFYFFEISLFWCGTLCLAQRNLMRKCAGTFYMNVNGWATCMICNRTLLFCEWHRLWFWVGTWRFRMPTLLSGMVRENSSFWAVGIKPCSIFFTSLWSGTF
jgi:hypothetical protein